MASNQSSHLTTFRYRARSEYGEPITGTLTAKSREAASTRLAEQGLYVIDLEITVHESAGVKSPGATRSQIAWQMSQLATMLESGMSLSESLGCLADQAKQPRLKALLEDVHRAVCEGQSLSDAMAMQIARARGGGLRSAC